MRVRSESQRWGKRTRARAGDGGKGGEVIVEGVR